MRPLLTRTLVHTAGLCLLLSAPLFAADETTEKAAGDIEAGKAKAAACMGCHGPMGIAMVPNYPSLAGQKPAYLATAMQAYKDGTRNDPMMKGMVMGLNDTDIINVAAYYASLPRK